MSALSLKAFQLAFMDELAGKRNTAFREQLVPDAATAKITTAQRIDIYCQNHLGARVNALANIYTCCKKILGSQLFDRLAANHVSSMPSEHWDLNFHGEPFIDFLSQVCQQHRSLADFHYLADLARLEWQFHLSYFADAAQSLAAPDEGVDNITFIGDPSLSLFCSQHPVYTIWYNNINDQGNKPVVDDSEYYYYAICRESNIPQFYQLNQAQFMLLTDCLNGHSLAQLAANHGELISEELPLFISNLWLRATT
jgi:hypothetical protein